MARSTFAQEMLEGKAQEASKLLRPEEFWVVGICCPSIVSRLFAGYFRAIAQTLMKRFDQNRAYNEHAGFAGHASVRFV
jgi:hypothetical protein